MNRIAILTPLLGLGLATVVPAQEPSANVAQPTSPAPAVVTTPSTATAPTVVQAPVPTPASVPVPGGTQIVYTPQLPTAIALTKAAADQGWAVEKIVQTSTQVIAFYRNASGQPITVAYQSTPPTAAAPVPTPAPAVVTTPAPTVVYETAPTVVYERYPGYYSPYYYPGYWYPPVSLSLGFGFRSYRGGFHHR